jgi:hypothetical protein
MGRHSGHQLQISARRTKSSVVLSLKVFFSGDVLPFTGVALGTAVVCAVPTSVVSKKGFVEIGLPL